MVLNHRGRVRLLLSVGRASAETEIMIMKHFSNRLAAIALAAFVSAALVAPAAAQQLGRPDWMSKSQTTVKRTFVSDPAVTDSTTNYFPQINETVKQKPIRPDHKSDVGGIFPNLGSNVQMGAANGNTDSGPAAKFPGMNFSGAVPPDPDIAVGPTHIVQVVNGGIAFFEKDGTKVFQQPDSNNGFWSGLGATPFIFDPKAFYDPIGKRFYIVELELSQGQDISKLLIAVSDDDNPLGQWKKYRVEAKVVDGSNEYWLDYPGWGFSKDGVVCTGNMFALPGTNGFGGQQFISFNKSELEAGAALTVDSETVGGFTPQSARAADGTSTHVFHVERALGGANSLKIWGTSGFGTGTITNDVRTVGIPQYQRAPGSAPSGGGQPNDTIPDRIMQSFVIGNKLYAAHTTRSAANTAQVTWYEFDVTDFPNSNPTLVQGGNVTLPAGQWAYQPGIAANGLGDVSLIFTRSSQNIVADVVITSRKKNDPAGQMGQPKLLAASPGNKTGTNRWGDYADVELDGNDGYSFWGVNEVTNQNGLWGTQINKWIVSTPAGGGGGGLGTGAEYTPTNVNTFVGINLGGTVAEVQASDNQYYEVQSRFLGRLGEFSGIESRFQINEDGADVTRMVVSIEAIRQFGLIVTGSVFVWNDTTQKWDFIKNYGLKKFGNTKFIVDINGNLDDYVSDSGVVRVLLRGQDPINRFRGKPRAHILRLDHAVLGIDD